jgi:hypothetical protein
VREVKIKIFISIIAGAATRLVRHDARDTTRAAAPAIAAPCIL